MHGEIQVMRDYRIIPHKNTKLIDAYFHVLRRWDGIKKIRYEQVKARNFLNSVDNLLYELTDGNLRYN